MIFICLGLAPGTCDLFGLLIVLVILIIPFLAVTGLLLSFLSFIVPGLDNTVGAIVAILITLVLFFFIGSYIYLH